jgi:hypothetical protein
MAAASSRAPSPEVSVALVRPINLRHVDLNTEAGSLGNGNGPVDDFKRLFG